MNISEAKARCWAEIDFDALKHNYLRALEILDGKAQLICVLKANAYGLGAKRAARFLSELGASFFAVACAYEAREIKPVVPNADILIMGLLGREDAEWAIENDVILTLYNAQSAELIAEAAKSLNKPARVHIKADTGLHRLGFDESSLNELDGIIANPLIKLEGLYTHLALRDRRGDERQFRLFDQIDAYIRSKGAKNYMKHACDSIGMVRYPERHMDAVRAGAWLYGVCPNGYAHPEEDKLTLKLKTRVSDIHRVRAGECVGYDEDHPLENDSLVATLSAGYVDGYPRLNNVGRVEINGYFSNVLGLVCMDQMMIDVSHIPCKVGDEVTLLGGQIPLNEYAAVAKMNRNECLSRIGRRVPKIYIRDYKITDISINDEP